MLINISSIEENRFTKSKKRGKYTSTSIKENKMFFYYLRRFFKILLLGNKEHNDLSPYDGSPPKGVLDVPTIKKDSFITQMYF